MKKIMWIILITLAVIVLPVLVTQLSPKSSRSYERVDLSTLNYIEVSFENEAQNITLTGMLFVPEGDGPFPAVAIMHGSGTSSRQNNWYLALTRYLQENNVAVLLPDKRGSEYSEGDWRTSSYEDLATDTVAAIEFLKNQDIVEVSELGIIGMSQGGQISPLVVTLSPDVDFLIDVVGTSLSNYDVLIYEETNNLRKIGFLPGISDLIAYPSTYVLRNFSKKEFWDIVGNFDAIEYWKEISIPTIVLYGGADPNVPAEASKQRLTNLNNPNISINIYPGSEHALQDPPGTGEKIFRDEALQDILEFITSNTSLDN